MMRPIVPSALVPMKRQEGHADEYEYKNFIA